MYNRQMRKKVSQTLRALQRARHSPAAPAPAKKTWQTNLQELRQKARVPLLNEVPPPALGPRPGMIPVFFEVPWHRLENGWDILARRYARAMFGAGIDVRLYPWSKGALVDEVKAEASRFGVPMRVEDSRIYVYSTCFAAPSTMTSILNRYLVTRRGMRRVFFTMFERLNVARETAALLNQIDGVWVPCDANRSRLEAAGCRTAKWIPVPYFDEDPHLDVPVPREAKTFYWIGNWSPRKATENLILAFMRAFRPGEASLVLKTGPWRFHARWPEPESFIRGEFGNGQGWTEENWRGSIAIDRRRLTDLEMVSLHASGDVYVSASRGEGVDMPAFAAKLAGRRIITSASGGPECFLGESDILIPQSRPVPCHPDYGWEPESTYVDYQLHHFIEAFQRARREPPPPRDLGPLEPSKAANVGRALREWLT